MKLIAALVFLFLLHNSLAVSDLQIYFNSLDTDSNGKITAVELFDGLHHSHTSNSASLALDKERTSLQFNQLLQNYDYNNDGFIDLQELTKQFGSLEVDHTAPEQVHISLGNNQDDVTIIWITKYKIEQAIVEYGSCCASSCAQNASQPTFPFKKAGFSYTYTAGVFGWEGWIHLVELTGLETDAAQYCYRVGQNDTSNWSNTFSFRTRKSSPTSDKTVFAMYGDMGTIMPFGFLVARQLEDDINEYGPFDMIVHAGDLAYAGTSSTREFERIWDLYDNQIAPFAANIPYMTAVGNHEKYYNFTSFRNRFRMPAKDNGLTDFYYSFDYGNVHITSMCTEDYAITYAPGSRQYDWLENDLATANANRDKTPWLIIVGHRPMYSSDQSSDSGNLQAYIEPLLKKYNVDIAVWGHMHEYERTYPVYNNTVAQYPSGSSNIFNSPTSTVHLTIGTAGAMILERWVRPEPVWSAFRHERYGYGRLTVYNTTTLQFEFMQRSDRSVLDEFWLVK